MKKLSKTRIISSTVWIIIYILFIAVAIPCIGNKIVQDMKSEAKIELTSEEIKIARGTVQNTSYRKSQ